jgi:hypothetical protein
MNNGMRVRITAYVVVGVYSLVFLIYGITLPAGIARIFSLLPTILVLAFAIFDNWLWHVGLIPKLLRRPFLAGTWHGELTSYRRDDSDAQISSQHEIFFVIRQSFTTISLTLISAESKSRSAAAQVQMIQADDYVVQYQYQNEPRLEFRRKGSSTHTGGASIEVGGHRPKDIQGEYWTARETTGTFSLTRLAADRINSFDDGQRLLAAHGGN